MHRLQLKITMQTTFGGQIYTEINEIKKFYSLFRKLDRNGQKEQEQLYILAIKFIDRRQFVELT